MRAGDLRQVITIQNITGTTTGSYGGSTPIWGDFITGLRAKKQPLSGRELVAAQAAQNKTSVKFITRYVPGVTQAMRISHDGKYYNITAVINVDELNRELHIMTETGLNEG